MDATFTAACPPSSHRATCAQALASSPTVQERVRHAISTLPAESLGVAAGAMILNLAGALFNEFNPSN